MSRYLTSIKFSSLSKTRRRSEFPPLACNHRLLSVTVQTSTNVNFSSCVHRSSKRRNDTRSLFPFLFLFFFFVSSFWREEGCDIVPSFRRAKQKDGREDGDFDVNETKRAANKSSFSPLPLLPFLLIPLFFPGNDIERKSNFNPVQMQPHKS